MFANIAKLAAFGILAACLYKYLYITDDPKTQIKLLRTEEGRKLEEKVAVMIPKPGVITVIERKIYVAIGYALANIILIEGDDGIIIVDTTERRDVALQVLTDFRKITKKPLKAVIVTHFHHDHILGAAALLEAEEKNGTKIEVFMHAATQKEFERYLKTTQSRYFRGTRQFGVFLNRDETDKIDKPLGPGVKVPPAADVYVAPATQTYQEEATYTVAGVTFKLFHTPGETIDHTTVWIPDWNVAMVGDNVAECFPNVYTMRGSKPRDDSKWYRSLDKIRFLYAEYLVLSHGPPIIGKEEVFDVVTRYRDAIQYVYDQTFRWMNKGLEIDEIVEKVRLPPGQASHRFLTECYGQVSWNVRGVYRSHMGWFNGDPADLNPLSKQKKAEFLLDFVSTDFESGSHGVERLLKKAQSSLEKSSMHFNNTGKILFDQLQWGLELASNALKVSPPGSSYHDSAKNLTILALKLLGTSTLNNNARNYYLSYAAELESGKKYSRNFPLNRVKVETIMDNLKFRFNAELCDETKEMTIIFDFPDVKQVHAYTMRHCVLDYNVESWLIPTKFDTKVIMPSTLWKAIISKMITIPEAIKSGDITLEGNSQSLKNFLILVQ